MIGTAPDETVLKLDMEERLDRWVRLRTQKGNFVEEGSR